MKDDPLLLVMLEFANHFAPRSREMCGKKCGCAAKNEGHEVIYTLADSGRLFIFFLHL